MEQYSTINIRAYLSTLARKYDQNSRSLRKHTCICLLLQQYSPCCDVTQSGNS